MVADQARGFWCSCNDRFTSWERQGPGPEEQRLWDACGACVQFVKKRGGGGPDVGKDAKNASWKPEMPWNRPSCARRRDAAHAEQRALVFDWLQGINVDIVRRALGQVRWWWWTSLYVPERWNTCVWEQLGVWTWCYLSTVSLIHVLNIIISDLKMQVVKGKPPPGPLEDVPVDRRGRMTAERWPLMFRWPYRRSGVTWSVAPTDVKTSR